ncbi:MAG: phosphotransferase family protein [Acidimicrobiia bacterium]
MFDDVRIAASEAIGVLRRVGVSDEVAAIQAVGGGGISSVFEMSTRGGASYIVKVYPESFAWKLAKEVFVYERLSTIAGLPVPTVIGWDDSRMIIDAHFLVLSKLPGVMLSGITDASLNEQAEVYHQLGMHLRAMHKLTFDQFGYLYTGVVEGHSTNRDYMQFQFNKKLTEFRSAGGPSLIATAIERFVEERVSALDICKTASLCHDDVYENNLLVERTHQGLVLTGLLDVENAVAGDPLIDLSKTWLYAIRTAEHKWHGLIDGYGSLGHRADERLDLYRLYHSLELWDWFAQLGNSAGVASVTPDLEEFSTSTGAWAL